MNLRGLQLKSYCVLMTTLPSNDDVRSISCDIIEVLTSIAVDNKIFIKSPQEIEKLFTMIHPLLYDDEDGKPTKGNDDNDDDDDEKKDDAGNEDFENEQNLVAKLIHLIRTTQSTDIHYKSLHLARKYFGKGGEKRLLFTFPPLVFNALRLIQTTHKRMVAADDDDNDDKEKEYDEVTVKPKKMFQFVHQICTAYGGHSPEIGVGLWLQGIFYCVGSILFWFYLLLKKKQKKKNRCFRCR